MTCSSHPWREMTCFEIVLTTRTNEGIFFNLFVPPLNRSHQFYSWTVSISFASQMIWNTGKIIAEVRSYIIKWCCRCRGRIRRLSSLMSRLIRVFAGLQSSRTCLERYQEVSGPTWCPNIYYTRIKCKEPSLKLTLNWYHVSETKLLARQTPSLNEP